MTDWEFWVIFLAMWAVVLLICWKCDNSKLLWEQEPKPECFGDFRFGQFEAERGCNCCLCREECFEGSADNIL